MINNKMERKTTSDFSLQISGVTNFKKIDMHLQKKVKDQEDMQSSK